jgi:ubiquitin C-terminal hydrolase
VLVHSGGAYGGHYFAYIFDGKEWYKYDDAVVKKVSKN